LFVHISVVHRAADESHFRCVCASRCSNVRDDLENFDLGAALSLAKSP